MMMASAPPPHRHWREETSGSPFAISVRTFSSRAHHLHGSLDWIRLYPGWQHRHARLLPASTIRAPLYQSDQAPLTTIFSEAQSYLSRAHCPTASPMPPTRPVLVHVSDIPH